MESGSVAVVGSAGQLGYDLMRVLGDRGVAVDHERADVRDAEAVRRVLKEIGPAWVINCASKTNVDACEDEPEEAFAVNAVGALNVARAAVAAGARTCYISTDYVFHGDKPVGEYYNEDDAPDPINVYGASKLAGEILTKQADENALIVRVSSLFGVAGARGKGGNFVESILKKARAGERLVVVNDQWMTPTYTADGAKAIVRLVDSQASGVVNVSNSGSCSWHEFAVAVVELAGLDGHVAPVAAASWTARARRPRNSALAPTGLREARIRLPSWQDATKRYLEAKSNG